MLAAQSVWVALPASCLAAGHVRVRRLVAIVTLALAATFLHLNEAPLVTELRDFEPHARPKLTPATLPSGLVVQEPTYMQCWDAPPPCSPFHNDKLRLRVPDDLGGGFTVAPPR